VSARARPRASGFQVPGSAFKVRRFRVRGSRFAVPGSGFAGPVPVPRFRIHEWRRLPHYGAVPEAASRPVNPAPTDPEPGNPNREPRNLGTRNREPRNLEPEPRNLEPANPEPGTWNPDTALDARVSAFRWPTR